MDISKSVWMKESLRFGLHEDSGNLKTNQTKLASLLEIK